MYISFQVLSLVVEMDVRYMDFKNESFDLVIDKGTLDAILVTMIFII